MEIRHVPGESAGSDEPAERVLADDVHFAETFREQTKGLMFRDSLPTGYALVFEFHDSPRWVPNALAGFRSIHMLFVKVPLDVLWLRDGRVERVSTLSPWTGFGLARADTVIELPAGAADGVKAGDEVRIGAGE